MHEASTRSGTTDADDCLACASQDASVLSLGIAAFLAEAAKEGVDLHSMMLVRHGQVVAEVYYPPYSAETPHRMYSVTKSFTSTAIGLAVADHRLSVGDRVIDIFPELAPETSDEFLAQMTVRHLLTMSAEHPQPSENPLLRPTPSIRHFLAERLKVQPGSRFEYSNACSFMLAAIVQRVTGQTLQDYLRPRLFEPLAISATHWLQSPEGVTNGAWGLHLTTAELARFGQLCLQRGRWGDRQLVPARWIDEATSAQVPCNGNNGAPDWSLGYGYQFWRCRDGAYRADGLLGQFCVVFPDQDAVFVCTACTMENQRILDLLWQHIVPHLGSEALMGPDECVAHSILPTGTTAPIAVNREPDRSAQFHGRRFIFDDEVRLPTRLFGEQTALRSVELRFDHTEPHMIVEDAAGSHSIACGLNGWLPCKSALSTGFEEPLKTLGGWAHPHTFVAHVVFVEAGFPLVFRFDSADLMLELTLPPNPGLDSRRVTARPTSAVRSVSQLGN